MCVAHWWKDTGETAAPGGKPVPVCTLPTTNPTETGPLWNEIHIVYRLDPL